MGMTHSFLFFVPPELAVFFVAVVADWGFEDHLMEQPFLVCLFVSWPLFVVFLLAHQIE